MTTSFDVNLTLKVTVYLIISQNFINTGLNGSIRADLGREGLNNSASEQDGNARP